MIYVFLFFCVFLFFVALKVNNNDIFAPICIIMLAWVFSSLCAIYNIGNWGIDLSNRTIYIYVGTLLICLMSSIVSDYLTKRTYREKIPAKDTEYYKIIIVRDSMYSFFVLFHLLTMIIVSISVWKIAGINGFAGNENYSVLMAGYRSGSDGLSGFVTQLYKIAKCSSYIFLYIGMNNCQIQSDHIFKNVIRYFLPVILFCLSSLMTGSRTDTLHIFIAALVMYYVTKKQATRWSNRIDFKMIVKGLIVVFAFFAFFSFIRSFVGRLSVATPVDYITAYAGGSIQLFDLYLDSSPSRSVQFGQISFYSLWQNIEKLHLGKWVPAGLEFRLTNGKLIGNMYTSIRRYYQDFGLYGNFLLQFIMVAFYTSFYRIIKKNHYAKHNFSLVAYSMIVSSVFMHSIDETFFSGWFCLNTVIILLIARVLYAVLVEHKVTY